MKKSKKSPKSASNRAIFAPKSENPSKSQNSPTPNSTNSPKLSILIPVYNVEKFLPLCLDSISNQSFLNFETILIDDGSIDSSSEILDEYAASDQRFRVFHRPNHGYGAALNFALKHAKGDFIAIVEPDDFIHKDMFKTLVTLAETTSVDIVKCSFFNYYGKTGDAEPERVFHEINQDYVIKLTSADLKNLTKSPQNPKNPDPNRAIFAPKSPNSPNSPENLPLLTPFREQSIFLVDPSIWSCVYRHEFLKKQGITFLETPGASFQDTGFQFKTFAAAKNILCLETPFYYYRRDNENSSVKSLEKVMNLKTEFDSIDETTNLTEISAACRFRAYIWNLNRLSLNSALRFAKVMREDYVRIKQSTPFRANFYLKHNLQRAAECTFAVTHPKLYTYIRPVFRLYNFCKHKLFLLLHS